MATASPGTSSRTSSSHGSSLVLLFAVMSFAPLVLGQSAERVVFVANNGNLEGSVTAFHVNADGSLTFLNRVITGTRPNTTVPCPGCNPYEIAISPNGKYLATGHASTNDPTEQISVFTVATDGTIAQVGAFPVPGTPMDVVWISDELLAAERTDTDQLAVYRFDPNGPTLTERDVVYAGGFSTYLALDPSRKYLYASDSGSPFAIRAFRAEPDDSLTLIDTEPTGSYYPLEMALTHDGTKLYSAGGITQVESGFAVAADGTLSPLAGSPFAAVGNSPSNVFCSTDDHWLLVGHGTDATLRSLAIDPNNGNLTYSGYMFDVGIQGSFGDVAALDDLVFVVDNWDYGVYSFTLNADGSFTQHGSLVPTGGIAARCLAVWKPSAVGDLNCDGVIDNFDINPFVLALTNSAAYGAMYPNCNVMNADVNGDDVIDNFDINPFVQLLTGG